MTVETIRCVPIWSGWVRATHWLMAVGVVFQYVSAQAIAWGASDYDFWREWHMIAGELVLLLLVGRVILAFILPAAASWRATRGQPLIERFKQYLRDYVRYCALHPEHARIMVGEIAAAVQTRRGPYPGQ